ncbi:hypothetical protein KIPB_008720 [Kipferlia bialata]|uniref:Uncharacterized protein n=1 Tax=Kipferlia bialata TaxID=797122 RepID=A0A9K3D0I5_9EUKA|nr:hypothetical protein KIPB_008720 [Kipferlia bialata]|eukprot:g8720.t1
MEIIDCESDAQAPGGSYNTLSTGEYLHLVGGPLQPSPTPFGVFDVWHSTTPYYVPMGCMLDALHEGTFDLRVEGSSLLDKDCPDGPPLIYQLDDTIPDSLVSQIGTEVITQTGKLILLKHLAAQKKRVMFQGVHMKVAFHSLAANTLFQPIPGIKGINGKAGRSLAVHGLVSVKSGFLGHRVSLTDEGRELRQYLLACMREIVSPGCTPGGLPPYPDALSGLYKPRPYQLLALAVCFGGSAGCLIKALGFSKKDVPGIRARVRQLQARHEQILPTARALQENKVDETLSSVSLSVGSDEVVSLKDVVGLGYLNAAMRMCIYEIFGGCD